MKRFNLTSLAITLAIAGCSGGGGKVDLSTSKDMAVNGPMDDLTMGPAVDMVVDPGQLCLELVG